MRFFLNSFITTFLVVPLVACATQEEKVRQQFSLAQTYMLANISPSNGLPGSILASPSIWEPNYYFHWVRDAALITHVLVDNYTSTQDVLKKNLMLTRLKESISFDRIIQKTENLSRGLGEPKFMVTGLPFNDAWGRPQYDGPAIRATSSIMLAEALESEGHKNFMNGELLALIQDDLDFIALNWSSDGYDIWEEIYGLHFYTGMVQYRALTDGVRYFGAHGDLARKNHYQQEAQKLAQTLERYFDKNRNRIIPTLRDARGTGLKVSDLDSSILLGVLHGNSLSVDNDALLNSVETLREFFAGFYPINSNSNHLTLTGRYPEDVYDGIGMQSTGGNPWFITTHALAELHCQLADEITKKGKLEPKPGMNAFLKPFLNTQHMSVLEAGNAIVDPQDVHSVTTQLRSRGLEYLETTILFGGKEGRFSEQINRKTGLQQGAKDLTWSYASFITASRACIKNLSF